VLESGLRGRRGAEFLTGRKWQTVATNTGGGPAATVVVNGAEGEPGTFEDLSISRRNAYRVIEGACIAARAVHADRVIIALKASFTAEVERTRHALAEMEAAKVLPASIEFSVFEGPDEYLYGEETALLETIDGRGPFPRVVPPYRVGLLGANPHRRVSAGPALVNNIETIANVPRIVARGARWFRSVGTPESPATVVGTLTGDVRRHGVGEVRMGTPLRRVLETIGGGATGPVKAVLSGVANPLILGDQLDVPVSHEGMRTAGAGLGCAGFIVFSHTTDMVAVAAGVARFLAVESCGQCTPCKTDGNELSTLLERLARSNATSADLHRTRSASAPSTTEPAATSPPNRAPYSPASSITSATSSMLTSPATSLPPNRSSSPNCSTSATTSRPSTNTTSTSNPTGATTRRRQARLRSNCAPGIRPRRSGDAPPRAGAHRGPLASHART
jgi:NADH-quinone oxidoreductase subunit F